MITATDFVTVVCYAVPDFGLRRVPWRHRNALSVKERLFLSLKSGMNSLAFSSCLIYKSYIGQTNRKEAGAADCSRSLDTLYTALGDTVKKVVEFAAQSITSLSNLVGSRSIQIQRIILLKLRISEQTPLMWKQGKTWFHKHKSPPFTMDLT